MSRGFVKEDDLEHAGTTLAERPISPHVNYVTPQGFAQLKEAYAQLSLAKSQSANQRDTAEMQHLLAGIERDLRYYTARIQSAQIVNPSDQAVDRVLFGASVTVSDDDQTSHVFQIVGEDEADASSGKVSYVSPIARALLGRKIGDVVQWVRPAGTQSLEILAIHYEKVSLS